LHRNVSRLRPKEEVMESIRKAGLIAILRRIPPEVLEDVARVLVRGGLRICEVTWDDDRSPEVLSRAISATGGQVVWGMGTVTEARQVDRACEAGASFIVTPVMVPEVIEACVRRGVLSIIGAFSPTEICTAWRTGADLIKVFPARALGPSYFSELRGPFPQVPLVAVGGVSSDNAAAFLRAGAWAVAAGSKLVPRELVARRDWEALCATVRRFVEAVREVRDCCCPSQ